MERRNLLLRVGAGWLDGVDGLQPLDIDFGICRHSATYKLNLNAGESLLVGKNIYRKLHINVQRNIRAWRPYGYLLRIRVVRVDLIFAEY